MAKLQKKGRRKFGDGGASDDDWAISDPPPSDKLVRAGVAPGDKPYPGSTPVYEGSTHPYRAGETLGDLRQGPLTPDRTGMYPQADVPYREGELVFPVQKQTEPRPPLFYKWGWGRGSEPDIAEHEKLQQQQEDWAQWQLLQKQREAGMPRSLQRNADMAKPPEPPPNPQMNTSFSRAERGNGPVVPAVSSDLEIRQRDPNLKSDFDQWKEGAKAKGGALKFDDGGLGEGEDFTPDSWYGDAGGISTNEEPQLQRPASETAERERREGLLNDAVGLASPTPGQNLLRFDPGAPPKNLLRFDPAAAAQNAPTAVERVDPAAAAQNAPQIKSASPETLADKFKRQQLEAWQNLRKQEHEDIFNPDQKPLLDYVSEVGKGNVGAWHTVPGQSDLTPLSNDSSSYSIGFDPASGDRIFSQGQNWFYTNQSAGGIRKPFTGNAVLNKTSIFPQGPAPSDEDSTVQQTYGGTTPPTAPAPPATPTSPPAASTPKTSFVPPGTGTIDASPILGMIDAAANKWGVPRDLLYGHVMAESGGNANAVSPKGAQGIMQVMPGTAAGLGLKNPFDPRQAIDAGAHYLQQLYQRFKNWDQASMAYNAGPGNIARGVVPDETKKYLPKVKQFAAKSPFQKITKGLSSMGNSQTQSTPQPQPVDIKFPPLPNLEPANQTGYMDTLKKLMGMTDLGWAKGGEVHPDAAQDREQTLGILREKKLIKKTGGRAEFAKGGLPDVAEPPKKIPGKDVLHRAPLGHALVPVLHTTIVIGVSPKKGKGKKAEKKAEGGLETAPNFPTSPPRKPRAIPPRRGKTPRGVGKAIRGWGKTGR